jgi:hypothetical protein
MSTVSLALRYGLRLDASEAFIQGYVDGMRLDQRGQGVACGKGWIPRSKKCSRDKATATPKEAKARTAEKARERAKLKGEVKAAKGQKPRVKEKPEPKQDPAKLQKVNAEFSRRVTDVATEYLKEANNAKPRQGEIAIGARHVELESMGDSLLTFSRTLAETGDVGKAEAAGMEVANSWAKNWQRNVKGTMSAGGEPKGNSKAAANEVAKAAELARKSQESGKLFSMPSDIQGSERVGMENRAAKNKRKPQNQGTGKTPKQSGISPKKSLKDMTAKEIGERMEETSKKRKAQEKQAIKPLPNPKPADPAKLEAFNNAFSGSAKDLQSFVDQAVSSQKFQNQKIEITRTTTKKVVPASVSGDLAFAKEKDLRDDGKGSGYSVTHIPSGMKIAGARNAKEARAVTAALAASGLDWSGNPRQFSRQEMNALQNFLSSASFLKFDSSDISLAEALYG